MLLSSSEINDEIDRGRIRIHPFAPALMRSSSYSLRLAARWMRWKRSEVPIQVCSKNAWNAHLDSLNETSPLILRQGDLVLASTEERIALPYNLAGFVFMLSHAARFGLTATAGSLLVRPGYGIDLPQPLTLELASLNPSPLEISAGTPVCHLAFVRLSKAATPSVKSIYEEYNAPCPPLLYEDMANAIGALTHSGIPPESR